MPQPFTLLSSPLQGFTDFRFRNALHKYFGGIDVFYAPYIRFNGKPEIKSSYQRDLNPDNNEVPILIPQVMTASVDEFQLAANYVKDLGYDELNWNLGCPYPMVTKRGMGSGLIANIDQIDAILDRVHQEVDIKISMKMRLGYEHTGEILESFETLEKYPLKSIAIHARTGKQLYKGGVHLDAFQACLDAAPHTLYYNGDITSVEVFKQRQERFPAVNHWMIGRGLIADPWLPNMIKNDLNNYPADRWSRFSEFHDTIYEQYDAFLQGPTPIKMKMQGFWNYFAQQFDNPQKTFKKIKKANNPRAYKAAVSEILNSVNN
ncbi:tRNA dihydrouridine synthase [Nonlabens ponticola]|uniref:tRNA-dihydrouridine synthase n=1 Tax=Nonlabens ponticola TaxID=2496866 RepID=A0A3S9MYU6_9FLAO|nr:tRNA-dihydrouridine synthase family protein [Nonlabens ponticola]AZQ44304.1 tRNA-dihydrouridine synthase family protein [Nonlabens ponticola]